MQLVLSLFPGIDLLGRAFKESGFCVVQGGDPIYGGDVREEHYPPGKFAGVIGGPPCQSFSQLRYIVQHNGYEPSFGNLIPDYERVVSEVPVVEGYGVHTFLLKVRSLNMPRWAAVRADTRIAMPLPSWSLANRNSLAAR